MANYEIRLLGEDEFPLWNEFVSHSPQGTLFHKTNWLKASRETPIIYGCFKSGRLVAGLPLVQRNIQFGMKTASHPPLTPYLGLVFKPARGKYVTQISAEKAMGKAIARSIKTDFNMIHFNFPPGPVDLQPFIWEGFYSSIRYTYLLSLDDLVQVWAGMDDKRRNDICRAERDGLHVDNQSEFEEFFTLVRQTFQRQEIRMEFVDTAFHYNDMLEKRNQCRPFVTRDKDGIPIAGVYIIWDTRRAYYLLGGYNSVRTHRGASALAMWEAIKFTKEELQLSQFDFEGSMIPQVEQFFRGFGGRLTPYYSVTFMRPAFKVALYLKQEIHGILERFGVQI